MIGPSFICNGELLPISEAVVSLGDINYSYGFGVYETVKIRKGCIYFPELHGQRLLHSASIIGLEHLYGKEDVVVMMKQLVDANQIEDANFKILLIGSPRKSEPQEAHLYIIALNPLFPSRKDYRQGATAITVEAERQYPQAKSLNMMVSAIAFRRARAAGAYDALLVNRDGCLTEGTRTNLFVTNGETIYTPPADRVLEGVAKLTVSQVIREQGIELRETDIMRVGLKRWEGAFLTSTSTKVMPLRSIDGATFAVPTIIRSIMQVYDRFLDGYAGR